MDPYFRPPFRVPKNRVPFLSSFKDLSIVIKLSKLRTYNNVYRLLLYSFVSKKPKNKDPKKRPFLDPFLGTLFLDLDNDLDLVLRSLIPKQDSDHYLDPYFKILI